MPQISDAFVVLEGQYSCLFENCLLLTEPVVKYVFKVGYWLKLKTIRSQQDEFHETEK